MRDERKKKHGGSFSPPPSSLIPRSKRRFGQNFLVDERVVERIVQEVGPRKDETIVEIGPGHGALTSHLLGKAGRLLAIEFDRDLVPLLRTKFASVHSFSVVEGDALAVDLCTQIAPTRSARVVANLPYYISTAILQRLMEQRSCITEMVLMLQREVVERITAKPATSERGFLTVLVEAYCEAEALFDVPPTAFRPVPKVWSTLVRLRVRSPSVVLVKDERLLWEIASAGFAQRRKTILNNLRSAPPQLSSRIEKVGGEARVLERAAVEARRRAETLTLDEWLRLTQAIADFGLPS